MLHSKRDPGLLGPGVELAESRHSGLRFGLAYGLNRLPTPVELAEFGLAA